MRIDFQTGTFYLGDCFDVMDGLDIGSVDMVLNDPPYGTTACAWDSVLPLDRMWSAYWRLLKPNGAAVLTASQPFTTTLIASQIERFKYCWVWDKVNRNTGFGNVSFMPLKRHEDILVFVPSGKPVFNKQMSEGTPYTAKRSGKIADVYAGGGLHPRDGKNEGTRNPVSILPIKADVKTEMGLHPTQKPVALFEYLIRTYTNPGELVLDNTAGSGTTAVAAMQSGRRWICIERDPDYFAKAIARVYEAEAGLTGPSNQA